MKSNNVGNIKLVSLLFLLGSSSALLLIPAVIQKESYEIQNVKGNNDYNPTNQVAQVSEKYQALKRDYIEEPIQNIKEKTNEISEIINDPIKIISKETEAKIDANNTSIETNLLSQINQSNTKNTTTEPSNYVTNDHMIKITREMVENCKIITEEYNKKGN